MAPWDSQKFFKFFFIEDGVPKIILYWGPWDLHIYKSLLLGDEVPNIIIIMAPWDSQKFVCFFIEDGVLKIIFFWGPWDLHIPYLQKFLNNSC